MEAHSSTHYRAPWGRTLIAMSTLSALLLSGLPLWWVLDGRAHSDGAMHLAWTVALPLLLLGGAALYTVRGYSLGPGVLEIHRLLWKDRLPLAGLQSAEVKARAMRGSIRTFGNGGLFSFTGRYWNKELGAYRAFVTDFHETVVLRWPDHTVVLSPSNPATFAGEAMRSAAAVPPV